jgi:hypothetical protein
VRRKISAHVDGGTSGPSIVCRRGARTPIGVSGNLTHLFVPKIVKNAFIFMFLQNP